jgi:hypothetical protein
VKAKEEKEGTPRKKQGRQGVFIVSSAAQTVSPFAYAISDGRQGT